jgi:hypothetical protein
MMPVVPAGIKDAVMCFPWTDDAADLGLLVEVIAVDGVIRRGPQLLGFVADRTEQQSLC